MDTNVKPCKDFSKYACGDWERRNAGVLGAKIGYSSFTEAGEKMKKYLEGDNGYQTFLGKSYMCLNNLPT